MSSDTIELLDALAAKKSKTLAGYLNHVVTDSRPPRRLKDIIQPWQKKLYAILQPMFVSAAGMGDTPNRATWITAPKGHSKTSTVAQLLNWLLCYSQRSITATVGAADRDQARILIDRMKAEAGHNPWLNLKFRNYQVIGPTGQLDVLSSDAPSSSGRLDDVIIIDEITWHKKPDLTQMLLAARHKRPDTIMIVISNSGCLDTWQHELWKGAKDSANWIVHEVPPYSASWMDQEAITEDKRILLPSVFARLHENRWVNLADESPYITREQMAVCVDPQLAYRDKGEAQTRYILAIDAGLVYDRTVAALVHSEGEMVVLDRMDVWAGSQDNEVQIAEIERYISDTLKNFRVRQLVLDPYQLVGTAQRFERKVEVERFSFGGGGGYRLAENLRSLVLNQRLRFYPGAGRITLPSGQSEDLIDETAALIVEEKAYGTQYRLNHLPGKHDDRVVALALAALAAEQIRKATDPTPLLQRIIDAKQPRKETDMAYKEIKHIQVYGTYQAAPTINGEEVRLNDYPTSQEAAWAVNVVHELLGTTPPNHLESDELPKEQRQAEIRKALIGLLTERKLYTVPETKPKTKAKAAT